MIDATASGITSLDVYFNVPQSQLDILLITNPNGTSPREFTVVDDTLLTQRRVILTAAETATDAALAQLTSEPTAILSPINRVITLTTTTPTSRRLRRSDSPPTDDTPQRATRRRTHVSRDAADVLFDRLITPDQSLSSE